MMQSKWTANKFPLETDTLFAKGVLRLCPTVIELVITFNGLHEAAEPAAGVLPPYASNLYSGALPTALKQ